MAPDMRLPDTAEDLRERIRDLQARLDEAEETLRALRGGEVDAIVTAGPGGGRIYTLKGADEVYRGLVEKMAKGALTLAPDGLILFSSERFAAMAQIPLERVIGARIQDFFPPQDADLVSALLGASGVRDGQARLKTGAGDVLAVDLSLDNLALDGMECLCLLVTDSSERKRNEAIVAAEKLARSILEQAATAVLVVDPGGRIIRASHPAQQLAAAPVLLRHFDTTFPLEANSPSEDYSFAGILSTLRRGQDIAGVEATLRTSSGSTVDLLVNAALLTNADGELLGVTIVLNDVTKLKRTKRALLDREAQFRTLANAIPQLCWMANANGRIFWYNQRWYEYTGTTFRQMKGWGWRSVHHPEVLESVVHCWKAALASAEPFEMVFPLRGADGMFRPFLTRAVPVFDEQGKVARWFGTNTDISEQRKIEDALRESSQRERQRAMELQAIMEAVPVNIFIAQDPECRVIVGNRTVYEMLRAPRGSNISASARQEERPKHWRETKDGRELSPDEMPMQIAARTGKPVLDFELEIVFDNGERRQWLGNAMPLFDENGRPRGAVGAFVDITERKRTEMHRLELAATERSLAAEKALRETEAELARVARGLAVGELAASIAHEVNQPLAGVITNAEAAMRWLAGPEPNLLEARESLTLIIRDGNRASGIIRRIREFTRKGGREFAPLKINAVILESIALARGELSKRQILTRFELAEGLPAIRGDRIQLQQVLLNLIINGADAMAFVEGPKELVVISRESSDGGGHPGVRVAVRDCGHGVRPEVLHKIFEPFFTTKPEGVGMGLSISRSIVEAHGGGIWAEAAEGSGLTIQFTLPAASENAS